MKGIRMQQIRVVDAFQNQVVHICVGTQIYHAAVAGDCYSAECLETGDRATGLSRDESLRNLAAKLVVNGHRGPLGITG